MPRIFHLTVFDDRLSGTQPVISDSSLNEMLGRADALSVQVRSTGATKTSGTVDLRVELQGSNDGMYWKTVDNLALTGFNDLGNDPVIDTVAVNLDVLPAFLRFRTQLDAASAPGNASTNIKIDVCGRTE